MDYHNKMIEERDTKIKELEAEIKRLQRAVKQGLVIEEQLTKKFRYTKNILTYLESKVGLN